MQKSGRQILIGNSYALSFCLVTAFSSVAVKFTERSVNPLVLAGYAFLFSTILFFLFQLHRLFKLKTLFAQHSGLIVKINVATMIMWLATFFGLQAISPAIFTALFFGILPIATIIITVLYVGRRHVNKIEWLCAIGIAILLAVLSIYYDFEITAPHALLGLMLAIVGGFASGFTNIYAHRFAGFHIKATQVLAIRFLLLIITAGVLSWFLHIPVALHNTQYLEAGIVALTSVALPLFFLQKSFESIDPVWVSYLLPFVPVFVFVLDLFVLKEPFNLVEMLLLMILTAVLCVSSIVKSRLQKE